MGWDERKLVDHLPHCCWPWTGWTDWRRGGSGGRRGGAWRKGSRKGIAAKTGGEVAKMLPEAAWGCEEQEGYQVFFLS